MLPWLQDQERQQYIVPYDEATSPGFRFRLAYDTIFHKADDSGIWSTLTSAEPTQLKTDNIQSLAIYLGTFEQRPFQLLGYEAPFSSGLKELIRGSLPYIGTWVRARCMPRGAQSWYPENELRFYERAWS
jgi:hypothetical protein